MRVARAGLGLVALVALSAPALAQTESEAVNRGIILYDKKQYAKAVEQLTQSLRDAQLDKTTRLEGDRYLAFAFLVLGDEASAERVFRDMLRVDPGYQLPPLTSESVQQIFARVRGTVPVAAVPSQHAGGGTSGSGGDVTDDGGQVGVRRAVRSSTVATGYAPLHLTALAFSQFVGESAGGEIGASYSPSRVLDLGLLATLGSVLGGRVEVRLHPRRDEDHLFAPFASLRAAFHAPTGGVAAGGGGGIGVTYEMGPGRFVAGLVGELYSAPSSYYSYGVLLEGGYEIDLFRPKREVVHVAPEPTEAVATAPVPARPPPVSTAQFRGTVTDLEQRPLRAVLRFVGPGGAPAREFAAAPGFALNLSPGEYAVQAAVPGYLVRGRNVALAPGETVVYDFALRPAPQVRTATLRGWRIETSDGVHFAPREARILPQSFGALDEIADLLLQQPALKVVIEGHTTEARSASANLRLAQDRATSVRDYLVDKGVAATRLVVRSRVTTRGDRKGGNEALDFYTLP
jgi:outer membrane protein OmpA-like peptidoglycan-associated protein